MNELLIGAFLVALVHTAIPSHWLCFVLVGRARGWRLRRTMGVAAAAGALHVVTTVALGILLAKTGQKLLSLEDLEQAGGWILAGLGALYLVLHFTHKGHHHDHEASASERVALGGLVLAVTISPCSAAILILVGAAAVNMAQVALIAAVLLVTTVGNMVLLVGLTGLGVEKLPLAVFDRYEKLILGLVLAGVGTFILVAHRHDDHKAASGIMHPASWAVLRAPGCRMPAAGCSTVS
jgi:putative Mn2+ efflux pump MntP